MYLKVMLKFHCYLKTLDKGWGGGFNGLSFSGRIIVQLVGKYIVILTKCHFDLKILCKKFILKK